MPIVERIAFHRASGARQTRGRGYRRIGRSLPETRFVERSEHLERTASFRPYVFGRKKKVPPEDAQLDSERFQKVFDFRVEFCRVRFREPRDVNGRRSRLARKLRQYILRPSAPQDQPVSEIFQGIVQRAETVMKPPSAGSAGRPRVGIRGFEYVDRNHGSSRFRGFDERGIVRETKVFSEPVNDRRPRFFVGAHFCDSRFCLPASRHEPFYGPGPPS